MSANLLDGIKPTITQYGSMADGVITSSTPKDAWHDVARWLIAADTLADNQTIHIGISAKWHGAAATTGAAWASVKYADAAGNINRVDVQIDGITTEWKRFSLSAVVPSGMHIVDFNISADHIDAAFDATNPVLSYGSSLVLAIASCTLAWSAGILATVRYYQLAAPTAATPAVPTSSSSLGSWTETEPAADVTKVLWTCDRTIYADGTESWSKASKSTSYEAAKDAKSTANTAKNNASAAQSTADGAAKQANIYHFDNGNAGDVPKWIHLGTLTSAGNSSNATIEVKFGDGSDGLASQNSTLTITIKDGWQSTPSATTACGVTAMRENCDNALVDVLAQSATVYDVWVYAPWQASSRGDYSISGSYAAWRHSGATQKDEPATSATQVKQDVAYRLADATKAQSMAVENSSSIRKLSDRITSEVTTRTKTDTMVSEVSSRLTQTASGLSASISKLSETDKKVNAWFDFEADSAGNPQLKMGSSTSPVVGRYTNSGLAYTSRDGTTIMELDASRSATVSDHIEAQDVKIGKWKWVQTQGGTHLTLVWAG